MKPLKKRITAIGCVLVLTAAWLYGCAKPAASPAAPSPFQQLTDELFKETFSSDALSTHFYLKNPENYGITLDEYTFGRFSVDELSDSVSENKAYIKKLEAIDDNTLSEDEKLTKEILIDSLQAAADLNQYPLLHEPVNPLTGQQAMLPILANEYTFYTQEDVEHYLTLLEDTKPFFESILEFEQTKAKNGTFMTEAVLDDVLAQCKSFAGKPEDNLMVTTFANKLDTELPDLDEKTKTDYIDRNKAAVAKYVIPAYETLHDGLAGLRDQCSTKGPLCSYKDGSDYYEALIQANTGTTMTSGEMASLLEEKMQEAILQLSLVASTDSSFIAAFSNGEVNELKDTPEAILQNLCQLIKDDFPEAAEVSYTVKYVDEALREYLSPAFYINPPIDDFKTNKIYINAAPSETEDIVNLFTTLAHEGYPGHLYQSTYYRNTNPDKIRFALDYPGYSEGWATYVEMLSYDWAYEASGSNAAAFMRANQQLSLYLSARVDIGIHGEGWTRADLKQYLGDNGFINEDEYVDFLYNIVLQSPANYQSYAVGSIMFETLREKAEDALDDKFDAKEFHKFILEIGPAPFDTIENYMQRWIEAQ